MKRILQRLLATLTVTGGLMTTVTLTAANAGIKLNHSEPIARTR